MILDKLFVRIAVIVKVTMLCILILPAVGGNTYAQKTSSDDLLKQALHETNITRNYSKAIDLAQKGLQLSPDYTDIHLLLGRLYMLTDKPDEARKELNIALKQQPGNIDALNYMINLENASANYEKAIHYIDIALQSQKGNKDLLIKKASILKAGKQYVEAYKIIDRLQQQDESNIELATQSATLHLAVGRIALNEKAYDSARKEFLYALKVSPRDTDALNYLINIESLQDKNVMALQYANMALEVQPESREVLVKKIVILDNLAQIQDAYALAKPLAVKYREDKKIASLEKDLYLRTRKNRLGLSYNYTGFERTGKRPWKLYSAYYIREEKFGTFLARVNYADRSYDDGWQVELEGYPKHGKRNYSFFNLAYSPAAIFPKYRVAYSYFAAFPKGWEGELGMRYQYNNKDFVSYAASVGKYLGSYWLNFRAFVTPDSGRASQSYTLTSRYYLAAADNYLTVIAGTGVSPDDRTRNFQFSERIKLRSARLSIGFQKDIWRGNILGILGTWNNQEYVANRRENEYDIFINFQHRF
jgi:YaiO family outer membrane protein